MSILIERIHAELDAAKETIMRYETTAENCEAFREELAAIYAAPVAKQVVLPDADRCFELASSVFTGDVPNGTSLKVAALMSITLNEVARLNAADQEGGQDE